MFYLTIVSKVTAHLRSQNAAHLQQKRDVFYHNVTTADILLQPLVQIHMLDTVLRPMRTQQPNV